MSQRGDVAGGEIEFDSFHSMDRKKHDAGRDRVAVAQLPDEIFEAVKADAADPNPRHSDFQDRSPELFSRLAQGDEHHGAAPEGGLGFAGDHPSIVMNLWRPAPAF